MNRLRIRTPSRLHFGLLGWGPNAPRQFGGVGLMIEAPGIELSAEPSDSWSFRGPLAERSRRIAERVRAQLETMGSSPAPLCITVERAPPEHSGLGVGTQLSAAVARVLAFHAGLAEPSTADVASWTGRGRRSGVGLHGARLGGLILDGGRGGGAAFPPLLAHHDFPGDWGILLVLPERGPALHGSEEAQAFAALPPIPEPLTDRLCRIVLLTLLPGVVERDIAAFGSGLTELQQAVGRSFATAQGGIYAHPELEDMVGYLRDRGLHGVGQSSWGPAIYAFSDRPEADRQSVAEEIRRRFRLPAHAAQWTRASQRGAVLTSSPSA